VAGKTNPRAGSEEVVERGAPPLRCNRSMQPNPPLSSTTMLSFLPSLTDVAISEFIIR